MKSIIAVLLVGGLVVTGCTSTGGGATSAAAEAATPERAAMAGTWTGTLDSGASVRVRVPQSGNISYAFKGNGVPISGSRMSGNSLVSTISSGGTITLSPSGDGLLYRYNFQSSRASTTLTRS